MVNNFKEMMYDFYANECEDLECYDKAINTIAAYMAKKSCDWAELIPDDELDRLYRRIIL